MKKSINKLLLTILIIYTVLILFFLFFSFDRLNTGGNDGYQVNLIPSIIHLRFPTMVDLEYIQLCFFNFGNFAGFIPFGILFPILYKCRFIRFISFFLLGILIIETTQMVTYLGSFDINDVIVNTLGAVVGFCAYKIGFRFTSTWSKFAATMISLVILVIAVIGFSEWLNNAFTKKEGPIIALNELKTSENIQGQTKLQPFNIGEETIEPNINMYESKAEGGKTFTYILDGNDIMLSSHYGIPDDFSEEEGRVIISVNGQEVESYANHDHVISEFYLDKVNELTITIEGKAKLWDVTFKEMTYWWN